MPRPKLKDDEKLQTVGLRVPFDALDKYQNLGTKERKDVLEKARACFERRVKLLTAKRMIAQGENERLG